jgi:radical SAM superfamily enzyme YgiQ (UPF0313 family)
MPGEKISVLFIGSEDEENLSIRYPAASLVEAGYTIEIASFSNLDDTPRVLDKIKKFSPNIIALSLAFQSLAIAFFVLVESIRKSGFLSHIIVGGHFPTFEYKKILDSQTGIDSVLRFEGERALAELAEYHAGKRDFLDVSNLVFRDGGEIHENSCINRFPELDELPFPVRNDRAQVRLGENFATLVASRGCWHSSCSYCCIGAFHAKKEGKRHALRSPENIAWELSWLYHVHNVRLFQFHDDNFLQARTDENLARLDGLMAALKTEGVDYRTVAFLIKARPDSINDQVATRLADLGVVGVFLGVENASLTGLKSLI